MALSLVIKLVSGVLLLNQMMVVVSQINEPSQYAATAIPKDPSSARQVLGYNKYEGSQVQRSDKTVLFGNNWEQYDSQSKPQAPAQGQNQYYGNENQYQQPYRYYRSILVY